MNLRQNIRGIGLPFFQTTGQQNYLKKHCYKDLSSFKLACPQYKILPFQIIRIPTIAPVTQFYVQNVQTGVTYNLLALTGVADDFTYYQSVDLGWIVYSGAVFFESLIPCGFYIVHVVSGDTSWESEVLSIEAFGDIVDAGWGAGIDDFGSGLLISDDDFLKININEFITP